MQKRLSSLCCLLIVFSAFVAQFQLTQAQKKQKQTEPSNEMAQRALLQALQTNVEYCRQWFDEVDTKSLRQTAQGLLIIASVLESRAGSVGVPKDLEQQSARVKELTAAAGMKNKAETLIQALEKAEWSDKVELIKRKGARSGKVSNRQVMMLLEATLADAKTSIALDDSEAAMAQASTIADVVGTLSRNSKAKRWLRDIEMVTAPALQIAAGKVKGKAQLKQVVKQISRGCASCHDRR